MLARAKGRIKSVQAIPLNRCPFELSFEQPPTQLFERQGVMIKGGESIVL